MFSSVEQIFQVLWTVFLSLSFCLFIICICIDGIKTFFMEDMQDLYAKGNVTFSVIYTELPQCSFGGTMMEINQNGTPKYWIEFVQK